jgi:TatD DNase family protein
MIIVGTDRATSEQAVALAEAHENIWAIVGLHPTDAAQGRGSGGEKVAGTFDASFFEKLAAHPKVVGIGECGLDYFHIDANATEPEKVRIKKNQRDIFNMHIALAEKVNKPLMLHIRNGNNTASPKSGDDAYIDALAILRAAIASGAFTRSGNVHFFAGSPDIARQFVELGFSLSFTGVITFAKEYHEIVKAIPLDRIMSETDAPFVSPVPHRGKRNEPAYVVEVARAIAAIRGEDPLIVSAQLVENARTLFKL